MPLIERVRSTVWDVLRRVTPVRLRGKIKAYPWFTPVTKALFGNEAYSTSYYEDVERIERASVEHIAIWIVENLKPRRILDVGCGPGHLMAALHRHRVEVFGVDLSRAALTKVAEKRLPAEQFDLRSAGTELPGSPYDLVVSCEVAEHLDARFAETFVSKLTAAAPIVYMTAAEPDASIGIGLYHVNEQPNVYWIELMKRVNFVLDEAATKNARQSFSDQSIVSYLAKPLVFRAAGS